MEKIEKEVKVTRYVAFDGTEFEHQYECENYERSGIGPLLQEISDCIIKKVNQLNIFVDEPHTEDTRFPDPCNWCSEPYNQYYILVPKTRHDVYVLNQILEFAGNEDEKVTGDDCFNMIVLALNCYSNTVQMAHIMRPSKTIKRLTDGMFEVVSFIKADGKVEIKKAEEK